jgi:mRNA interferase YafQ
MRRIERSNAFKRDYRRVKAIPRYRDVDQRLITVLEFLVDDRPVATPEPRPCLGRELGGISGLPSLAQPPLIYAKPSAGVIRLVRLGSHTDLFD